MIRRIVLIFTLSLILKVTLSQEALTGLQVNFSKQQAIKEHGLPVLKSDVQLTLPFFDDFSGNEIYPHPDRWADNFVFINDTYPVFPITTGVATFDVLDENGLIYPDASQNSFRADYLTSHPIRLDSIFDPTPRALHPSDSIYLSFYFQPQGLGFNPARGDSLVLEFFHDHPVDSLKTWVRVWSRPGMTLSEFFNLHSTYFKLIHIPITDTAYFKPGFRFRFYNIASIRFPIAPSHQSNRDQWHIDYVYLDKDRTIFDVFHPDVAFVSATRTFLKSYQNMPYNQYKQNFINEMRDSLQVRISNLYHTAVTGSYRYEIRRSDNSQFHQYESGTHSFQPYYQSGYVSQVQVARPPVNFVFPADNVKHATFNVNQIVRNLGNFPQSSNDTIRFSQVFSDYYAYDDGSAEAGYGLTVADLIFAYRFRLNAPDTLCAVNIFFNRTLNDSNVRDFYLQVWNDFGGKPGTKIYENPMLRVIYGDGINGFHNYKLDENVVITNEQFPGLVFYVAIRQTTSDLINIGFDRNNISKENIFYTCPTGWCNTMFDGSLMMRPVMGTENISGISETPLKRIPVSIYPNPAKGFINIRFDQNLMANSTYKVFNMTGMILLEGKLARELDVSSLPPGMYLLQITNGQYSLTEKFAVSR